jgi:hypothetical protein
MTEEKIIKTGDRVVWHYRHYLNRKNYTDKAKHGVYYGNVKHTVNYYGEQLAAVKFDGNQRSSRVPYNELRLEDNQ